MSFRSIQRRSLVLRALAAFALADRAGPPLHPGAGAGTPRNRCSDERLRSGDLRRRDGMGRGARSGGTPEEAAAATVPTTTSPATAPAPVASGETRVTLSPLMLRSGPGVDAEPILVIPAGGRLTLTREGAADGYVTVDFDGVTGWVYADLIAREDELG